MASEKKQLSDTIHTLEKKIHKLKKEADKQAAETNKLESQLRERFNDLKHKQDISEFHKNLWDHNIKLTMLTMTIGLGRL